MTESRAPHAGPLPSSRAEPAEQGGRDARTPLSIVRGYARILLGGLQGPLTPGQRRLIEGIDRQALKLSGLLDERGDAVETAWHASQPKSGSRIPLGAPATPESTLGPARILVADDDEEILDLLRELLKDRYEIVLAEDGGEALALLQSKSFQLAIVDLQLPVLDGFQIVEALRNVAEPLPPAFMFLSAQSSPQAKVRGLRLGAADYVTKPFDPDELLARISRIVTAVQREESLRFDALTDPMTGLANYRSFSENLEHEIERSRRYDEPLSLITVDLDNLKRINDEHGHPSGNDAIRAVARVLRNAVRAVDTVARQGGDEFAILLPNTGRTEASRLAERLRAQVASQTYCGQKLSISVGVASREGADGCDLKSLVQASDDALYRAKRAGRDRVEAAPTQPR
jgi:diguanylate cyclase (GGDEF)-like protein